MERRDYSKLSLAELVGVLLGLVYSFDLQSEAIGFGGTGAICFSQLFAICRKWFDDADGSLANRLLSGMGKLDSAEGGLALWRLAVLVKSDADVERIIQLEHDFAATREELGRIPSGAKFLQAWSSYMEQHGHHCRGEIELKNPRWRETPNAVLNMVRSYVANMGAIDPLALQSRQANQRRQLEDECRRKLTNPVERWLFTKIMLQAQLGCAARENIKSEAVRILGLGRRLLLELGDRLAAKGVIDSRDDVFFLRLEEIEPTVNQRLGTDPRTVIQRRRAEFEKNLQITPPSLVVGTFDASHYTAPTFDPCAKVLTGLGVSPGLVTGAARVILHSDTQEKVLPGEILVAPFTDPGWSPYFIPAAAIVMDQGGLLSHGSIIAREYGIPAVVNVGHATQIIRTGQKIAVDGNRGEVRILE
jgi:pyruvate,water dikinase